MNWRRGLLTAGGLGIIAGIALLFTDIDRTIGWGVALAGIAALIVGVAPEQLLTIFKIPELRRKIFITLAFLVVYRIGYYVPLPMIDQAKMAQKMAHRRLTWAGTSFFLSSPSSSVS